MEKDQKSGFWRKRVFRFDEPESAFELLETEHGAPPLFGGRNKRQRDALKRENREGATVPERLADVRERLLCELRGDVNPDLILRGFTLQTGQRAIAAFLTGMADADMINDFILRPSMQGESQAKERYTMEEACRTVFSMHEAELTTQWTSVVCAIEEGRTAVFFDGETHAALMDTRGYPSRNVSTPQNEVVILGPHEAFTENIRTNITLLRRIIRTNDLVCDLRMAGGENKTRIAILYRDGVANASLVSEVKRRFAHVNTRTVCSVGTLEQLTEASPFSPIPQSLTTERPDRVAAYLMEGHVAVLCEGSPFGSVMPATLFMLMSAGEDAYLRAPIGTIIRIVRYLGAFLSVVMPGYFLALALHHQGMLSGEVLATVISSRSMVFLPLGVEMIFLLLVFQLVREAGLSVPGALGQSVGIIGGLILGQAAVSANIVSKVVLIIVALTGLGNFTIPDYSTQLAAVYFRILLVILAWIGGLLGLCTGVVIACAYLASLKSYGVPFLTPLAPKTVQKGPVAARGRLQNRPRPSDPMNTGAPA